MSRELEILRTEYQRCLNEPVFDNPADYCIILNLIQDRIEELTNEVDEYDDEVDYYGE